MKILITGGNGFIGKNLVEQLNKSYEIFSPTSLELNLLDQDMVGSYFKKNNFDVIIHTATWNASRNSTKDKSKILFNNLRMFFNLTKYKQNFGKFIFFGSGAEFDRLHYIPKMKEEYFDVYMPTDEYGFSKYIMTKYIQNYDNMCNLRLFGVFGKYEDWEIRFISNACCKVIWDLPITIKQNVYFDYLFIDDLIKLVSWFIENKPREKVYNVCTSITYDLVTLANKILKIADKKLEIKIDKNGLKSEYSGDNSKLLNELEGFKFENVDKCIKNLYEWYLKNKKHIIREKLLVDK